MLKKFIYVVFCLIVVFLTFITVDRVLGYPLASKSMEKVINDYKSSIRKDCSNVVIPKDKNESLYIYFLDIKKGTSKCIIEQLKKENKNKIEIEMSSGGYVFEALILSDYINSNNIEVKINRVCHSACTYLLMASKKSEVCAQSEIGFHEYRSKNYSILNKIFQYNAPIKAYSYNKMEEYGVNRNYLDTIISKTPNNKMYILNHKTETKQYGFSDQIIDCKLGDLKPISKKNNIFYKEKS